MKVVLKGLKEKEELIKLLQQEYLEEEDEDKDEYPEFEFLIDLENSEPDQLIIETDTNTAELVTEYYPTYILD